MVKQVLIRLCVARANRMTGLLLAGLLVTASPVQAQLNREDIADPPAPAHLSVPSFPRPSAAEARILQRLSEPISTNWSDKKLEEALNSLEKQCGIEIWIDKQAMQDDGLDTDLEVSLRIDGVSLRTCLRLLLEPLGLVYVVEDEVMKITSYKKTETRQTTRIYPVGDLCETPEEAEQLLETIGCGLGGSRLNADGDHRYVVSSKMKTLTVRDSYVVQEKVQILLLALRDAQAANKPAQQPVKPGVGTPKQI
jgi:type II secretory pathway component GspD/PulD (secretin)